VKTKEQKQDEADARQAAHDARTPEQQMQLLNVRPGNSWRERDKLVKALNNGEGKMPRKKGAK
jgi:hypothetical protein